MPGRTLAYRLFQNVELAESRRILPRTADQLKIDAVDSSGGCIRMLAGRRGPARLSKGALLLSNTALATVSLGLLAATQAANGQTANGPPAVWQGGTIDNTNYNAATNWSTGNVPDAAGEAASFANAGSSTVVVHAPVAPFSCTFQNASQTYTISGADVTFQASRGIFVNGGTQRIDSNLGQTGGTAGIIITVGALTLTGTNTLTGGIRIDPSATLQFGNGGTTGSIVATSASTDNGLVCFDYSGSVTVGNSVYGSGNLEIAAGTVTLGGTGLSRLTGKLDRKALPESAGVVVPAAYVAPRTESDLSCVDDDALQDGWSTHRSPAEIK